MAAERLDLVFGEVFPVRLPERDARLPGESDAPQRPGADGQAVPPRLAAEAALGRALLDLVPQEHHRRPPSNRFGK